MPKSPEEWLKEVDTAQRPAVFKLFLGYAPGVGKTYAMLSEGVRRASRGEAHRKSCSAGCSAASGGGNQFRPG